MAILRPDSESSPPKKKDGPKMSSRGATGDLFKKKFGWKCKLFFSRQFLAPNGPWVA